MTSLGTPTHKIPLARPDIGPRELELVTQVLTGDVLAMGPFTERFEQDIASLAQQAHGVACSSGTAGLHIAVRALGIEAGHEVITTPFSFVASVNCFLYEGAKPVFVDIEEDSLGLDPDLIPSATSPRTRAILPVHVFGRPCRIDPMVEGEGRLPQQLRGPSSTDHERIESREPSLSLDPLQCETAEMTFGQIPDELSAAELRVRPNVAT